MFLHHGSLRPMMRNHGALAFCFASCSQTCVASTTDVRVSIVSRTIMPCMPPPSGQSIAM